MKKKHDCRWLLNHRIRKLIRIMKLTLILLCAFSLIVSANGFSQETKISMELENTSIYDILFKLEEQTEYRFVLQNEELNMNKKITLRVDNRTIEEILDQVFEGENVNYNITNKHLIVVSPGKENSKNGNTSRQSRTVKGTVTDSAGQHLPGVSIVIKGTTIGTVTDVEGNFALENVPGDAILVFSFVGMKVQEVQVANQSTFDIVMEDDAIGIEEVVAIGYGVVKKSDLTGSVGKVTLQDENERPAVSVEQILQGRVSGVQITQGSGSPGGAMNFVVRGGNSLGSNQPLIVLDGYPIDSEQPVLSDGADNTVDQKAGFSPLASLNPNEIESIEILKDASSTAIYGSRGANGVIIITTKQGKKGRDNIEFNYRCDVSQVRKTIDVLNSYDFLNYANEGALNEGLDPVYDAAAIDSLSAVSYDWQDEVYRTSISHDYQLSLSGGDNKQRYAIVLNHSNNNGVIENSDYLRSSARFNFKRNFSDRLKITLNTAVTRTEANLGSHSNRNGGIAGNIVASALFFRPYERGINVDGEINNTIANNPLTVAESVDDRTKNFLVVSNLSAEYKLAEGLIFKSQAGFNTNEGIRQVYYPRGTSLGDNNQGYAYQAESARFNYLLENTLNYNADFDSNSISAVIGYTWQEWSNRSTGQSAFGFANDNLTYERFQAASSFGTTNTRHIEYALSSFLGRINYSYKNKYLITFTGRADGSTRLAEGEKWDFFPSGAIGWKVHNEPFMKNSSMINTLKLRASYGLSGNQSVPVGATAVKLGNDAYVLGGQIIQGTSQLNMANPVLGWETTSQFNVGADIGLLDESIQFEVNYYEKTTKDLLVNLPIPNSTGFGTFQSNAGSIENKGIEFDLTAHILSRPVNWTVNANISFNKNEVTSLGPLGDDGTIFGISYLTGGSTLGQPIHVARVGNPVGSFYGFKIDGIYQNEEEVAAGPEASSAQPGDYKFVDINDDGIINENDKRIIGSPHPDFIFGFTNQLSYKQWDLMFYIQGVIGNDVANLNRYRLDALSGTSVNVSQEAYDNRWTGEGTSNTYPRLRPDGYQYFNARFNDFLVEDASFVRLKNITLSYSPGIKNKKYIKGLRLFVTATNLLTITNYSGYDPEVSAEVDNGLNPGVDNATYPSTVSLSTGLNIKF